MTFHDLDIDHWNYRAATSVVVALSAATIVTDAILDRHELAIEQRETARHIVGGIK